MNIVVSKRYRVAEKLGAGGMGEVYRAFDRMRGEDVALKRVLIEPEQLRFQSVHAGGDPRTLLAQEFRLLASMRHPNIISVLDYGVDGARQPFFTMTLLRDAIPLHTAANDLRSRVRQFLQVMRALEYLHRRGVIHRDLKPNNILVDVDGQVRVLDFGLALETEGDEHLSGTLAYMAPETLASKLTVPASDVHALGVMFYEALTGQHPFFHKSMASMMRKIISELPSESALRACLLPGYDALGDLIMACLDKDPVSRYERFEQHRDTLIRLAGEETTLEPALFRESFLQSARFVGRRDEYTQLVDGLGVT
ncbi:MAG: serine/threonine protein kinase, partial [Anaerolinea sp.]|nr:serine/threonine protein kinase [Anaerolinea sp.]